MKDWCGRTSVGMAMALVLMAQAHAERASRAQSGTAPCGDDKAWRVLVIAGEMQANSWCTKEAKEAKRKALEDKKKREREEFKRKQDEERAKREAEKKRRDEEKKKQEDEKKQAEKKRGCRGLGDPAECTRENPGKGHKK